MAAFGHSEVYILILPAFGIISQFTLDLIEKKVYGALGIVYAVLRIGLFENPAVFCVTFLDAVFIEMLKCMRNNDGNAKKKPALLKMNLKSNFEHHHDAYLIRHQLFCA